jgi:hypothetical protein
VSEYAALEIVGPLATVELEPDLVELLIARLDRDLEDLDEQYRAADDGPALDGLEAEIDELAGLRDAIHSVALEVAET